MEITKEILVNVDPLLINRPYQLEALLSIFRHEKCLVKMFCGTGKSRIIANTIIHSKKHLNVAVFPSLALINQYASDYVASLLKDYLTINISSEKLENTVSTTDPAKIKSFLSTHGKKLILVTYQSYNVLLENLNDQKIGLVCYDEAHHVVSTETQKHVFGTSYFEKEVFFTATPRNENGITMYDREEPEKNMCGELVYEYTYLQGLNDNFLNAFDVCVDMYTENTNASVYEAIARAILKRGTNRVLTFHSNVNGQTNTSLWNFVDLNAFKGAFKAVLRRDFPEKDSYYTRIRFNGMDGTTPQALRKRLLQELDKTPSYRSTNPDDKDIINCAFSQYINPIGPGMVIFLDHTEFKTAYALLERGVRPEQMLIPQRADNFTEMSQHEIFGSSVALGEFNDIAQTYLQKQDAILKGIYADYCSTLKKDGLPFVEMISSYKRKLASDCVAGVTLTLRNPDGVRFSGQDISSMEKALTRTFPSHESLFDKAGIVSDDGPYTYGVGAPMATWLIHPSDN